LRIVNNDFVIGSELVWVQDQVGAALGQDRAEEDTLAVLCYYVVTEHPARRLDSTVKPQCPPVLPE